MSLEQFQLIQADTNRAPAQEWIHLFGKRQIGWQFIPADVERADDHWATGHHFKYLAIDAILFLLTGRLCIFEIEEFRAEQADALGATFHCLASRCCLTNVRGDFHTAAICSMCIFIRGSFEALQM